MVHVWVAGKTVLSQLMWAIPERSRDEVLYNKSTLLYVGYVCMYVSRPMYKILGTSAAAL